MEFTVSILVPVWRGDARLRACVKSLLAQEFRGSVEVIVAASETDHAILDSLPRDPRLVVLTKRTRARTTEARNRAAQRARGSLLVFADADVIADAGWLASLVAASDGGRLCVAGAVRNGTPGSALGTVEYLVEFLDFHPARPPQTAWHGATCNLLVPRELWEKLGPFPEGLRGGEDTLLTLRAREAGAFAFSPAAVVTHYNRTKMWPVLRNQVRMGRDVARAAHGAENFPFRPLARMPLLAPVALAARTLSVYRRTRAWMPQRLRLMPLAFLALCFWTAGLFAEELRIIGERRISPTFP